MTNNHIIACMCSETVAYVQWYNEAVKGSFSATYINTTCFLCSILAHTV